MRSRTAAARATSAAGSWLSSCSIVRGPMIADVTAGWLTTKAMASSISGTPASSATFAGEDAHAVPLSGGEDAELDPADEQRVGRLLGAKPLQAPVACGP